MYLEKLSLLNYKNYEEANLFFHEKTNVFVGKNGSGKTNLLDAIFYLSLTKSAFSASDAYCIRHGESFFMVKGTFNKGEQHAELVASVQSGAKKVFRENQLDYNRLSDHIGKYPLVMIAPDDADLVKEGSELRRKFFDSMICQVDKQYLENLIQYNHALRQRNSMLKMFSEQGKTDFLVLETYDDMLAKSGQYIYERRNRFVQEFIPFFQHYYKYIVEAEESTSMEYVSGLHETDFLTGLRRTQQKDLYLQRTSFGIHRDDYDFRLGNGDLKRLGSQGQQKSFVIALKLSQYAIFEKYKGFKPLLLLDDIFDKLDDFRIARLLELIRTSLGQLFITDARPDRTVELMKKIDVPARVFRVSKGEVRVD